MLEWRNLNVIFLLYIFWIKIFSSRFCDKFVVQTITKEIVYVRLNCATHARFVLEFKIFQWIKWNVVECEQRVGKAEQKVLIGAAVSWWQILF